VGEKIQVTVFTGEDRKRYRDKVHTCLDVLARMLAESRFAFDLPMTGLEIELNLVDPTGQPAFLNAEVLAHIEDPAFQTELGQFNLEINVHPRTLIGRAAEDLESDVRDQLNTADASAHQAGASMAMVGILPTLRPEHLSRSAISNNPRYHLLDAMMLAARGEDLHIDIDGAQHLEVWADTIAPEAACTSVQFHLQVTPESFADHWNAAQCLAGVQVALGANSPYLLGRELWRETRIALFTQATDTRSAELKAQGVRPRVWFGERYVTSVFDLFEENIRYFPALLPVIEDEDPEAVLAAGGTPLLPELRLHNGTVWRWNRPVYDVVDGVPHLRVENRVLPSGPTVVDIMANGALYYGALRALVDLDRPVWSQMSFRAAEENFLQGAQRGLDAELYWPGLGEVPVAELVLRRLLPLAYTGLAAWGVDPAVAHRLLGIIEQRCTSGRNGATWQVAAVDAYEAAGFDRWEALRRMTLDYLVGMHSNEPVHTWELP
jgi:gamma-glutamyl:cysteine ligase YbdK (ATP-grasp superfamily)